MSFMFLVIRWSKARGSRTRYRLLATGNSLATNRQPQPRIFRAALFMERISWCPFRVQTSRSRKSGRSLTATWLRWLFLVPLNGLYEGETTGETINFDGKTDILIRAKVRMSSLRNVQFRDGPEYLRKKIDQLLGYATWRDSKLAVVVFNRGRGFSTVLAKIGEVVKAHPNFRSELTGSTILGFGV